MTALSQINAGARLTASMLRAVAPLAANKGADESVTSSTALQNDDALFVTLLANATYKFDLSIVYDGAAIGTGDIKWGWTFPSGTTMRYSPVRVNTSGSLVNFTAIQTDVVSAGSSGAGVLRSITVTGGTVAVGSTPGTLQLQWAQNTSSATPTIVHAESELTLWQTA